MAKRFYGSFDVTKITKERLVKGKKGTYCSVVIWENDEPDQFGNTLSIQESLTKEEREKGMKPNYIGNCKLAEGSTAKDASNNDNGDEDLPF